MKEYIIIDGYNVINAWSNLKEISEGSLEEARNTLIDKMTEYHSYTGVEVTIVFDAYRVKGAKAKKDKINNVEIVFTKKNQTADSYIEMMVEQLAKDKRNIVRVVTSDLAEQQVILGSGGIRVLPRELKFQYEQMKTKIEKKMEEVERKRMNLGDRIDAGVLEVLEKWRRQDG
ncbi:NYN domain-containing protein [Wukongibacter baidiensis]|uniref:NYN domain-containing protein n=1 Tax=Wukongibacter baidiensis TaxID=1723361 RepID=UPI003D7F5C1C